MIISNFRDYQEIKIGSLSFDVVKKATIDVTTGSLWWKKTFPKSIVKTPRSAFWLFEECLSVVPFPEINRMHRQHLAQLDLNICEDKTNE